MAAPARPGLRRPAAMGNVRRSSAAPWRHVDWPFAGTTAALAVLGCVMIYSATRRGLADAGGDPAFFLKRQAVWVVLGLGLMVAVNLVDYRQIRDWSPVLYGGAVAALVLVLTPLGSESRGAQAWFEFGPLQLQPSEFAKPVLIAALAAYVSQQRGELDVRRLVVALALAGVPMGLILLQPDVGTMIVFVAVVMGVLLVGGTRLRHIVVLTAVGLVAVVGVLQLGVLEDYQRDRLTAFLDQEGDARRATYNLEQSKIAIGAGGWLGKGLFQGSQTNLSYVPEQHTDFVFTAVGEELGFVGASAVLLAYGLLVWRTWRTAMLARDFFGSALCIGVASMLVFQVFQNVGMTMGLMPITGIPLPLLSSGGSSTLATFAALGLVQNVHSRRFT